MLLILDLGIKTVVKRSDVFHIWNFLCDNFFFFFLISALKEEKGRIKASHSRCTWRGYKYFRVFFPFSPLVNLQSKFLWTWESHVLLTPFQLDHWVVDWKEWVWFTCLKVREMVPIQRLWQRRAQVESLAIVRLKKKMWSTFMFTKCVLY